MTQPLETAAPTVRPLPPRHQLIAAAEQTYLALRDVEWSATDTDEHDERYSCCPWCGGGEPSKSPEQHAGHEPDCRIMLALSRAEGRSA